MGLFGINEKIMGRLSNHFHRPNNIKHEQRVARKMQTKERNRLVEEARKRHLARVDEDIALAKVNGKKISLIFDYNLA